MTTATFTKEVVLTRVLDAPREQVWKAWTEAERLAIWWGPKGFTNPVCNIELKVGGAIRIHMKGPDGVVYPMGGFFKIIDPPKRLVFTSIALDKNDQPIFENLNQVTLEEKGGKTTLTLDARVAKIVGDADPYLKGMEEGWTLSLDRLAEFLEKH